MSERAGFLGKSQERPEGGRGKNEIEEGRGYELLKVRKETPSLLTEYTDARETLSTHRK